MTFIPDLPYPVDPHPTWHVLDSTKLKCYRSCPRRFLYSYVLGWGSARKSVHLVWGECVHRMLAHCYRHGWDENILQQAIEIGVSYYRETFGPMEDVDYAPKTAAQLETVLRDYAEEYGQRDTFSTLHTEVAFRMRIHGGHVLAGRIDLVIQHEDSSIACLDWKTAGRMPSEAGINQWQMSSQMAAYLSALKRKYPEHDVSQATIRVIVPYKTDSKGKRKKTGLLDIPVILTDDQLDLWEKETEAWIAKITEDYRKMSEAGQGKDVQFFVRNSNACFDYARLCTYFDQCAVWTDPLQEDMPEGKIRSFWDPTKEKAEEVWDLT